MLENIIYNNFIALVVSVQILRITNETLHRLSAARVPENYSRAYALWDFLPPYFTGKKNAGNLYR